MEPRVELRPSLAIIRCLLIRLFSRDFLILSSPLLTEAGMYVLVHTRARNSAPTYATAHMQECQLNAQE